MKRTMQLGFLFLGGAALVAASPLGVAMAQVNCETFLLGLHGPIALSALAVSIRKNPRSPPALRSSKPRPQFIAR